jgi:hypothetical protein
VPFLSFDAESTIPVGEIATVLRRSVTQPRWFLTPDGIHPFVGRVSEAGFRIVRSVHGRDSFNPVLFGRFAPSPRGTRVRVYFTFHPIVWAFVVLWTTGMCELLLRSSNGGLNRYMPLFGLFGLWAMAVSFFYYGAARGIRLLRECLKMPRGAP